MNENSSVSFGFAGQKSDLGEKEANDAYVRKINRIESIKSLVNSEMNGPKNTTH